MRHPKAGCDDPKPYGWGAAEVKVRAPFGKQEDTLD